MKNKILFEYHTTENKSYKKCGVLFTELHLLTLYAE